MQAAFIPALDHAVAWVTSEVRIRIGITELFWISLRDSRLEAGIHIYWTVTRLLFSFDAFIELDVFNSFYAQLYAGHCKRYGRCSVITHSRNDVAYSRGVPRTADKAGRSVGLLLDAVRRNGGLSSCAAMGLQLDCPAWHSLDTKAVERA